MTALPPDLRGIEIGGLLLEAAPPSALRHIRSQRIAADEANAEKEQYEADQLKRHNAVSCPHCLYTPQHILSLFRNVMSNCRNVRLLQSTCPNRQSENAGRRSVPGRRASANPSEELRGGVADLRPQGRGRVIFAGEPVVRAVARDGEGSVSVLADQDLGDVANLLIMSWFMP